jgi:hypothetical protein
VWRKGCSAGAEHRIIISIISKRIHLKKNFVLRVEEDVYKALEKWAADEFRSVNGQIEWLVDDALKRAGRKKEVPKNKEPKEDK